MPNRIQELSDHGISSDNINEITSSLLDIINKILNPRDGLWRSDAAKIDILASRRETIFNSRLDTLEKIYWLMEDAKRYGALPFAGLARAGFIAVQLLKSLVNVGIFSQLDYDDFLESVTSVSGELSEDRVQLDKMSFINKYGHLRPGTYEITSPKYSDAPEQYFDWSIESSCVREKKEFSLTLRQMRELSILLKEHKIDSDPIELLEFIKLGIEYRELSKFNFTKNISLILSLIHQLGSLYNISVDELSYLEFQSLYKIHFTSKDIKSTLNNSINTGIEEYSITKKIHLPPVIIHPDNVWTYKMPTTIANFITQKEVTAHTSNIESKQSLDSKIVFITNADPGFDWVFSNNIAGLITMWGGINSHMAIRAGELGIPAVIGCGEINYNKWSRAIKLYINCAGKLVEIVE